MRRTLLTLAGIAVALAAIAVSGCGDDDDGPTQTPAPSATPAGTGGPTAEPSSRAGGIEGARAYLADTGLDGTKGDLTDPAVCSELPDKDFEGDFCVVDEASVYAPGLVILFIADADKQAENVWEVHLEPEGAAWKVTTVEEVPPGS